MKAGVSAETAVASARDEVHARRLRAEHGRFALAKRQSGVASARRVRVVLGSSQIGGPLAIARAGEAGALLTAHRGCVGPDREMHAAQRKQEPADSAPALLEVLRSGGKAFRCRVSGGE
jgi:hypothetical protein